MADWRIYLAFLVMFGAIAGVVWNEKAIRPRRYDGTDYYTARATIGMVLGVLVMIGGIALFSWGITS